MIAVQNMKRSGEAKKEQCYPELCTTNPVVVTGFIAFFITYSFDDEEDEDVLATPSEWSGPMCREREKRIGNTERHCLKSPSRNDEYPNDMSFFSWKLTKNFEQRKR